MRRRDDWPAPRPTPHNASASRRRPRGARQPDLAGRQVVGRCLQAHPRGLQGRQPHRSGRGPDPLRGAVGLPRLLVLVSILGLIGSSAAQPLIDNLGKVAPGPAQQIFSNAIGGLRRARARPACCSSWALRPRCGRRRATSASSRGRRTRSTAWARGARSGCCRPASDPGHARARDPAGDQRRARGHHRAAG